MKPGTGAQAERSNEAWIRELREDGRGGEVARGDLRAALVAGLSHALGGRAHAHVEDFAQEALIRVLERLDTFRGESRFTTWAMSMAVRVAWSELRRARWKDVSLDDLTATGDGADMGADGSVDAERALARARALAVLEGAIADLTERQRTVITAELRGMPQEEIGRRLGANRNAVYKLGHDGRRALLRALVAEGFCAEDIRWMFSAETRPAS